MGDLNENAWPEGEEITRELGNRIGAACPDGVYFFLNIATVGEGGFSAYVSNIERDGVVGMLNEMLEKLGSPSDNMKQLTIIVLLDKIIELSGVKVGETVTISKGDIVHAPRYEIDDVPLSEDWKIKRLS